jgi:predicted nucleic acid-binding protein
VILVDANILLYAEDSLSDLHEPARTWWDEQLSGSVHVCLCWPVLTAFIRMGTNARLHQRPLTVKEAADRVQSWLDQPCVRIIQATDDHWPIFTRMLRGGARRAISCRMHIWRHWPSSTIARSIRPMAILPAFRD